MYFPERRGQRWKCEKKRTAVMHSLSPGKRFIAILCTRLILSHLVDTLIFFCSAVGLYRGKYLLSVFYKTETLWTVYSESVYIFTCSKSLLDQRHTIPAAHQLHIHARQRGPRAHELDGQAGWGASGNLQALPAGTQGPWAWAQAETQIDRVRVWVSQQGHWLMNS